MVMATRELEQALVDAGVSEEQAKAVADAHAAQFDTLATKDDLARAIDGVNRRIDDLRDSFRHELTDTRDSLRHELTDTRDSLRHELNQLREDINARFRMLYVFIGIASGAIIALLSAILARL